MKMPLNWPAELRVTKVARADAFGSGGTYAVRDTRSGTIVCEVYQSSRGWAYSGSIGSHGQGTSGEPTLVEVLFWVASAWRSNNS